MRGRDEGSQIEYGEAGDPAFTVRTPGGGSSLTAGTATGEGVRPPGRRQEDDVNLVTGSAAAVRRLTPRECERLQGFPDDWTRWDADGNEQSDSARYRQLGNAVATPVGEWIAHRLVAVEQARRTTTDAA
jgi:DNA (cytosine-5)-methyltransferase 1